MGGFEGWLEDYLVRGGRRSYIDCDGEWRGGLMPWSWFVGLFLDFVDLTNKLMAFLDWAL